MDLSHEWFVGFSKSFGLFYLIALSIGLTLYTFWPSLGKRFGKAAKSILDDEDGRAVREILPEGQAMPVKERDPLAGHQTYTQGLLGTGQQEEVEEVVVLATLARADWAERIRETPVEEIRADPAMMTRVTGTAHALSGDSCAGCQGPRTPPADPAFRA